MTVQMDHARMELLVWMALIITAAHVWLDTRKRIAALVIIPCQLQLLKLNQNMITIRQNFNDENLFLKI